MHSKTNKKKFHQFQGTTEKWGNTIKKKTPENPWKDTEIEIQWFPNKQKYMKILCLEISIQLIYKTLVIV